jgi:hypothetical protein
MATLTINIPDTDTAFISNLSSIVKLQGYDLIITNDDDLSLGEFESLKKGLEEAVLIKEGKLKAIPASELWND